jgi:hypothetical protein
MQRTTETKTLFKIDNLSRMVCKPPAPNLIRRRISRIEADLADRSRGIVDMNDYVVVSTGRTGVGLSRSDIKLS